MSFFLGQFQQSEIGPNLVWIPPWLVHAWCHTVLGSCGCSFMRVFVDACGLLCLPLPLTVNVDSSIFSQLIIQRVCRLCFHLSHLCERTPHNYTKTRHWLLTTGSMAGDGEWTRRREGGGGWTWGQERSKDKRGRIGGYTGDKKDTQWREVSQQLL